MLALLEDLHRYCDRAPVRGSLADVEEGPYLAAPVKLTAAVNFVKEAPYSSVGSVAAAAVNNVNNVNKQTKATTPATKKQAIKVDEPYSLITMSESMEAFRLESTN